MVGGLIVGMDSAGAGVAGVVVVVMVLVVAAEVVVSGICSGSGRDSRGGVRGRLVGDATGEG